MLAAITLWLIIGTVVGALGVVTTGHESSEDMVSQMTIGVSGAVVGGLSFIRWGQPQFDGKTLLVSVGGALVFLALSYLLVSTRARGADDA